jgi:haloacetate dehalogenase
MFPGFREDSIDVGEVAIRAAAGGSGPPLLLLHGYPQTHVIWRKVAPRHAGLAPFMPDGWPEYLRAFRDPAAVHASCEDYRAAASIDLEHDAADVAAGRKVTCPLLALWGAHGVVERLFKALDEWRKVATDVRGHALPCGHYIPEEAPDALLEELLGFLGKDAQ